MSRPSVLTPEERAGIAADIAALPPLPDEALEDIALILAAFRDERRRASARSGGGRGAPHARV